MTLFPQQPIVAPKDRVSLIFITVGTRADVSKWLATGPDLDMVKKAAVLLVENASIHTLHRGKLDLLLKRVQSLELTEIEGRVKNALANQ